MMVESTFGLVGNPNDTKRIDCVDEPIAYESKREISCRWIDHSTRTEFVLEELLGISSRSLTIGILRFRIR